MDITNLNIADFVFNDIGVLVFKIPILILIFLYILFAFILVNRIKALNRAIRVTSANASQTLQTLAIVHFILAVSIFLITLVIV